MVTHAWGHQEKRKDKMQKKIKQETDVSGEKMQKIKEERKVNCKKNQKRGK